MAEFSETRSELVARVIAGERERCAKIAERAGASSSQTDRLIANYIATEIRTQFAVTPRQRTFLNTQIRNTVMSELKSGLWHRCRNFVAEQSGGEWDDKTIAHDADKLTAFVNNEGATNDKLFAEMLNALKAVADFYEWSDREPLAATPRQVMNAIAKATGPDPGTASVAHGTETGTRTESKP